TPASTSGWPITCWATVQVTTAPGATDPAGQVTLPPNGSVTATDPSVVVPVFLTFNVQVTLSPRSIAKSPFTSVTAAVLVIWIADVRSIVVVAEAAGETTAVLCGSRPDAVAVLVTDPASTSAWVITCALVVQVVDACGARVVVGHETAAAAGSLTATPVSVVVPPF